MLNLFVAVIWIIYFLSFLIIRLTVDPKLDTAISTTVRFKIFTAILIVLHFIIYVFYIGKIGIFKNNILIYPSLFVAGIILAIGGLILSLVAYYQLRKNNAGLLEISLGIFKKIRWPIQSGLIMLWFGMALIYNNRFGLLAGIALLIPILYLQTKSEERHFIKIADEKGLGEKYRNYIKNSWLMLPGFK